MPASYGTARCLHSLVMFETHHLAIGKLFASKHSLF
jgi:hypothetical protein